MEASALAFKNENKNTRTRNDGRDNRDAKDDSTRERPKSLTTNAVMTNHEEAALGKNESSSFSYNLDNLNVENIKQKRL
jgi:hypothetical protein